MINILSFLAFMDNFKWYHWVAIGVIAVIVVVALLLFRFNTKTQMKVSFNMDDETQVYNPKGLDTYINNNSKKFVNPVVVVVEIKNLVIVYKDYPKKRKLMMRIADLLLKGLSNIETVARIEFNKFAVIYSDRDKTEIRERLLAFDKDLNDEEFDKNIDIKFVVNFGVNENPRLDDGYTNVRNADSSITLSPVKDKNIYYYCDEVTVALGKQTRMNEAKQIAFEEKRFVSYIQPKVSLATGTVIGGEILCRWVDEMQNPIYSPGDFIPLFESNGFIKQIDDLMFENACMMAATLVRRGYSDIVISVNLSKADMDGTDIVKKLLEVCNNHSVSPRNIEIEITESAVMSNSKYISSIIMQLRQSGFKVAMDDFGKEYSSLSSLADNPFDTIKIDGVFFKDGLQTEKTKNIAKDILTMLSKLNCEIVCEGVENKPTLDIIASINRDVVIQGFYFSKPIPTYQFESFVETKYDLDFPEPEVNEHYENSSEEVEALRARVSELEAMLQNQAMMANQASQNNPNSPRNDLEEENRRLREQMQYAHGVPYPYPYPYPYPPYGYAYPPQQPQQAPNQSGEIEALKKEIENLKKNKADISPEEEKPVKPQPATKKGKKKAKEPVIEDPVVEEPQVVEEYIEEPQEEILEEVAENPEEYEEVIYEEAPEEEVVYEEVPEEEVVYEEVPQVEEESDESDELKMLLDQVGSDEESEDEE